VLRAHDDDRSIRSALLVIGAREFLAAHPREHEVKHDRARLDGECRAQRMPAVQSRDRLVALVGDGGHEHPARVGIILDHEHTLRQAVPFADLVLH